MQDDRHTRKAASAPASAAFRSGALGGAARLLLLATVINGVIFSAWSLFFNFYMLESGFSRDFLGLVNSAPSLAALLFGIPMGRLSDRLGRRRAILIGIAVASLGMALRVTLKTPALIVGAAFLAGIASSLMTISMAPLMMKLAEGEQRTLLFSLNFGLQTLSGAVGNLFAGQLPALFGRMLGVPATSAAAYQSVLLTSVLLGTTALIPMGLLKEPGGSVPARAGERRRLDSGLLRLTLRMASPNVLIGLGAAILIPYMNLFFREVHGVPDSALGVLFSLSALLTGAGSLVAPGLARRLGGKVRAVVFTQGASLGFLLLLGFTPWTWLAAISFLMRAALMNMSSPLYSNFAMEQTPERDQGLVNSVLNLSWTFGWAVGPYISAAVQARYGFTPLFVATAILYALATFLTWTFFWQANPKGRQP